MPEHPAEPAIAHDIAVDGGTVRAWSQGSGPAILLLHGWSLDHRVWQPQCDDAMLAPYRLVAIDRRGFGASTAPPDLGREAADLLTVARRLDLGRFILVGQSQAGRVALQFAREQGGRLAGMVLLGAPIGGFHPLARPEEDIPVGTYRALAADGHMDRVKALWALHPMMAHEGEDRRLIDAMLRDYQGRDLTAAAPPPGPGIAEIGTIATPTLVVTGGRDTRWRRLVGDAIAYGLRHGRRAEIADAGHLCNLDAATEFNRLLDGFAQAVLRDGAPSA